MLGHSLFFSETGFWPLYCQISTDLDKFCTHLLLYRIHLLPDLDHNRRVGGSRPNQNDYVSFVIYLTHLKSYIETTDRRNFGGKSSKWRWGRVILWKIPEFYSMGGARSKDSIFLHFYGYPSTILHTYRKQFYPKPMGPMESPHSEYVRFASLESLWPGIWQI